MPAAKIDALIPGLAELRAKEGLNRALAFGGVTSTVLGEELAAFTPRHRLRLILLSNAFMAPGVEPLEGDVFIFLWVVSVRNVESSNPFAAALGSVRQWFLRRRVARMNLQRARSEIMAYLVAQFQDAGEAFAGEDADDHSPWVLGIAQDASWWMNKHGGFTLETYLRTPYAVLQQLYRGWRLNNPSVTVDSSGDVQVEQPQFINESDRLRGRWMLQFRKDAADRIRSQVHRL